jgi:hypothetical protein
MGKLPLLFLLYALIIFIGGCASTSPEQTKKTDILYFSPDTVEITGVLHETTYLSVMEGSEKERINNAYVLELEKPVTITSNPKIADKPFRTLENIKRVEIENDFAFAFGENLGKRVILDGTLSLIREMKGFHRQVSTPVQIHVTKMLLAGAARQ